METLLAGHEDVNGCINYEGKTFSEDVLRKAGCFSCCTVTDGSICHMLSTQCSPFCNLASAESHGGFLDT